MREGDFFYPIVFPFKEYPEVRKRLWFVPLMAIVPGLNLLLLSGWKMDIIRRINAGDEGLPESKDMLRFLVDGILIWLMKLVYFLVPFLFLSLFDLGILNIIWEILSWLWDALFLRASLSSLISTVKDTAGSLLLNMLVNGLFFLFQSSIYAAGKMRYAVNNRPVSLVELHKNFLLVIRRLDLFAKAWVFGVFLTTILSAIFWILNFDILGLSLAPVLCMVIYYWSTGYEQGFLAREARQHVD